jgi:hypothetical protein
LNIELSEHVAGDDYLVGDADSEKGIQPWGVQRQGWVAIG